MPQVSNIHMDLLNNIACFFKECVSVFSFYLSQVPHHWLFQHSYFHFYKEKKTNPKPYLR